MNQSKTNIKTSYSRVIQMKTEHYQSDIMNQIMTCPA